MGRTANSNTCNSGSKKPSKFSRWISNHTPSFFRKKPDELKQAPAQCNLAKNMFRQLEAAEEYRNSSIYGL